MTESLDEKLIGKLMNRTFCAWHFPSAVQNFEFGHFEYFLSQTLDNQTKSGGKYEK